MNWRSVLTARILPEVVELLACHQSWEFHLMKVPTSVTLARQERLRQVSAGKRVHTSCRRSSVTSRGTCTVTQLLSCNSFQLRDTSRTARVASRCQPSPSFSTFISS